jgi:hypothetical protein
VPLASSWCTSKTGARNFRPPDPLDPDKSIARESQGPINEGDARFTTGREGLEGAVTEIETEGLACQLSQTATSETPWHLAFTVELGFRLKESPTSSHREPELGYKKKLLSPNQTQAVESVITELDLNRNLQRKEFVNPPRFVGESNSTTTFVPSFEKTAD